MHAKTVPNRSVSAQITPIHNCSDIPIPPIVHTFLVCSSGQTIEQPKCPTNGIETEWNVNTILSQAAALAMP